MKTYDERLHSIQKKARAKKAAVRIFRAATAIACVAVIVLAVLLWPDMPVTNHLGVPVYTAPSATQPPQTTVPSEPNATQSTSPITVPTNPFGTMGPPSDGDVPSAHLLFEATYLKTTQPSALDAYPATHLLRSVEQLSAFCDQRDQDHIGFEQVQAYAQRFDDGFFEKKSLIVLMVQESSGSVRHTVTDVEMYANGTVNLVLERTVPEMGTCDMAYWYIFVEVDAVIAKSTWICHEWSNGVKLPEKPVDNSIRVLGDLPEDLQIMLVGETAYNSAKYQETKSSTLLHGIFDGVYVYVNTFTFTNWFPSTETVNGLQFYYPDGYKMHVFSVEHGHYTLKQAFEEGILTADQLQEVYDNYASYLEKAVKLIPEDVKKEMQQAFIKQFGDDRGNATADDVMLDRVVAVFDNRYVLFADGIFAYLTWIETEVVNGYDFIYGSSQKMYLYYNGYYYRLQEACDAGLLSEDELRQVYENYRSEYWFHYVEE